MVVHNVYSSVKLSEVTDLVFAFPEVDLFVISKASSSAAHSGVPDAEKKAFMKGKRVLYIPDLSDINELFSPDFHFMVVPKKLSRGHLDFDEVRKFLKLDKEVVISVSGGDSTFTLRELEAGTPVDIGFDDILPPSACLAIILYNLFPK